MLRQAFRGTGEERYAAVAGSDFVLREIPRPADPFYTAARRRVDRQEGLNYLWTREEIESVLGAEDAKLFNRVYGVDRGPNFADPHHGTGVPDRNILFCRTDRKRRKSSWNKRRRARIRLARPSSRPPATGAATAARHEGPDELERVDDPRRAPVTCSARRYVDAARRAADFLLKQHRTMAASTARAARAGGSTTGSPTITPTPSPHGRR